MTGNYHGIYHYMYSISGHCEVRFLNMLSKTSKSITIKHRGFNSYFSTKVIIILRQCLVVIEKVNISQVLAIILVSLLKVNFFTETAMINWISLICYKLAVNFVDPSQNRFPCNN